MQAQPQTHLPWSELKGSAIEFQDTPVEMRFVLIERGTQRAGAWWVGGRPILFVPIAEA